jgi:glutamine amidotransferase
MGNIRAVHHKLVREGWAAAVSSEPGVVARAGALILPGVGHFGRAMENLHRLDLLAALEDAVRDRGVPILGICLGMQLLSTWSEEGDAGGLGWVSGVTRQFRFEPGQPTLPVPHVGWETLRPQRAAPLLAGIAAEQRFYFTHSFHVCCRDPGDVLAVCHYGYEFVAAVERGHIFGTQFHPEKSHYRGMRVIRNFVDAAMTRTGRPRT